MDMELKHKIGIGIASATIIGVITYYVIKSKFEKQTQSLLEEEANLERLKKSASLAKTNADKAKAQAQVDKQKAIVEAKKAEEATLALKQESAKMGVLQYNSAKTNNIIEELSDEDDFEDIKAVFQAMPSQNHYQKVADAYMAKYKKPLASQLKAVLTMAQYESLQKLMAKKPKMIKQAKV